MGSHHSKSSGDSSDSHICTTPGFDTVPTLPIVGSLDFYHLNVIVSGACTAVSCIIMLGLMFRHATHFSQPKEQAELLRICAFIPIYAVGTFIQVVAPASHIYLQAWLEVAQAFALASFFILICRLLTDEDESIIDVFLAPMRLSQRKLGLSTDKVVKIYRKRWILILQYPFTVIFLAIVTAITQAANIFCFGATEPYFSAIYINIIQQFSTGAAIVCVIRTYTSLKTELQPHRTLQKLLAFKLLIGLQFIQQIVYMILTRLNPSPLNATPTMSYTDMQIGIPLMLVSAELVIFSVFFHFAYSVTPYKLTSYSNKPLPSAAEGGMRHTDSGSYHGGPLGIRAWAAMFNPSEFIAAVRFAFTMRSEALHAAASSEQGKPLTAYAPQVSQPPPKYGYDASADYPQPPTAHEYSPPRAHHPAQSGSSYDYPLSGYPQTGRQDYENPRAPEPYSPV